MFAPQAFPSLHTSPHVTSIDSAGSIMALVDILQSLYWCHHQYWLLSQQYWDNSHCLNTVLLVLRQWLLFSHWSIQKLAGNAQEESGLSSTKTKLEGQTVCLQKEKKRKDKANNNIGHLFWLQILQCHHSVLFHKAFTACTESFELKANARMLMISLVSCFQTPSWQPFKHLAPGFKTRFSKLGGG